MCVRLTSRDDPGPGLKVASGMGDDSGAVDLAAAGGIGNPAIMGLARPSVCSHRPSSCRASCSRRTGYGACRYPLSCRDVRDLLAERSIQEDPGRINRWGVKFRPEIAKRCFTRRARRGLKWHVDKTYFRVGSHLR